MQEAQLERHSADGGAASLVGQSVDAANAAVTLATMRPGLDPASRCNTAAATTHTPARAVGDGNGAPKQAGGGPAATPAADTSVLDLTLDPEPPANSAEHNKAANMLAVERYKTFVPLASGDAGRAAHPSKTSGSRLCNFIASDIETMFPGVLRQTPILNESSSMEGENLLLGGNTGESTTGKR